MSSYEQAFAQDLCAPVPPSHAPLAFAVYRNTFVKACVDALAANFPALVTLLGDEWFRTMAVDFARTHPPLQARFLFYGDGMFGPWIRAQAERSVPERDWRYIEGVAALEEFWRQSHASADAPSVDVQRLTQQGLQALEGLVLRPHPAARWAWFAHAPVYSLWTRNRESDVGHSSPLNWQAEGALLTRPHDQVQWQSLSHAGCRLLDACAQGRVLAQAVDQTLAMEPDADLAGLISQLILAGAWAHPQP